MSVKSTFQLSWNWTIISLTFSQSSVLYWAMDSRFEPVITIKYFYSCLISIYLTTFWSQLVVSTFLSLINKCNQVQVFFLFTFWSMLFLGFFAWLFSLAIQKEGTKDEKEDNIVERIFFHSQCWFFSHQTQPQSAVWKRQSWIEQNSSPIHYTSWWKPLTSHYLYK